MQLRDEQPDYFVIGVIPKLDVDKGAFSQAFIKLDKTTYFPDRIVLISPDGKSKKDFVLHDVQPNVRIAADNFKGTVLGKPWTVVHATTRPLPSPKPPLRESARGAAKLSRRCRATVVPGRGEPQNGRRF